MIDFFKGRLRSFGYAFQGIGILFKSQVNAKIHLLAIILIVALGFYLGLTAAEWCWIVLCMGFVLCMEAINTALEFLVDLVSPERNPLAGKVKDVAAGAVLLSVIFAAVVWGIIFLPKLLALWS
ncbi:MAG: diacylglycerol kinase family protein [Bacteroidota bacterium]